MDEIVKILPNYKKYNSYVEDIKKKTSPIMLSGLTDSSKVYFAYSTFFYVEKPICIITYNEIQAKKIIKDLNYFTKNVCIFPKREIMAYDYLVESKENSYNRIECLNNIYNKNAKIVVTTIEAVMQKIISKDILYKNILNLKVGDILDLEEIKQKLIYLGYERVDLVETKSQFSIRGGIVDIAISNETGIRIEFFGDEIDSIRNFSISTQRSTDKQEKVKIYPAHEFVLENDLETICQKIVESEKNEYSKEDIELIKNGDYLSKVDKYFNSFYSKQSTFIDYIKDDYIIFLDEINKIKVRSENVLKDTENLIQSIIEKQRIVPDSLEILDNYINFSNSIKNVQTIYLEKQDIGFVDKQSMHAKRNGYSFSYREVNFFRSSMDLLLEEIQEAVRKQKVIALLCGNKENINKIKKILEDKQINSNNILMTEGFISTGFECYDFNLIVISLEEIFNVPQKRKRISQEFKHGETVIFADLKPGDYIVHKTNGIGQFVGVNTIKMDKITKDYIKIKYRDDDILYIPTNSLDNIRKYIGAGEKTPKLNRLRK